MSFWQYISIQGSGQTGLRSCYSVQYGHYSTPGSGCYNKLFEYQVSDEQMNEVLFQAMAI